MALSPKSQRNIGRKNPVKGKVAAKPTVLTKLTLSSQSPSALTVDSPAATGNVAVVCGGCSLCRKQNAPAASKLHFPAVNTRMPYLLK